MTIHLSASTFSAGLPALAEGLSAPLDAGDGGLELTLSLPVGHGTIAAARFHPGLSLLRCRVTLEEEVTVHVAPTDHPPLHLMLCAQGSMHHSIDAHHYSLAPLGYSLSVCPDHGEQYLRVPGHQPLRLCVVEIDRAVFERRADFPPDDGHHPLAPIFFDTLRLTPFLCQGPYSSPMSEVLRDLDHAEQYQGLARHTFLEAKTLELLSLALQQYVEQRPPSCD